MATPFLIRVLRHRIGFHYHVLPAGLLLGKPHRPAYTTESSTSSEENVCSSSSKGAEHALKAKDPQQLRIYDHHDPLSCKKIEKEIFKVIRPIILRAKEILRGYSNGKRLNAGDEQFVVDKLLPYHPDAADKIGCGIDFIMVDRHPLFRCSRCLFVVRTDGTDIDFSYYECLRAYIRHKYPSKAETFLYSHLRRHVRRPEFHQTTRMKPALLSRISFG